MKFVLDQKVISSKLLSLKEDLKRTEKQDEKKVLLDSFWTEVKELGTPLFEKVDDTPDYFLVTFLYQYPGNTIELRVNSQIYGSDPRRSIMLQLTGTDIYYNSIYVLPKTKVRYSFVWGVVELSPFYKFDITGPKPIIDKFNKYPASIQLDGMSDPQLSSMLMAPDYRASPWVERTDDLRGTFQSVNIKSDVMAEILELKEDDEGYEFLVYLPEHHSGSQEYPFVFIFDGDFYNNASTIQTPQIIDNLIESNQIEPLVLVLVMQKNRTIELTNCKEYDSFLIDEAIPQLREMYSLSPDPSKSIIAGVSLGGLMSVHLGIQNPLTFGKILCQSGSFWAPRKLEFGIPPNADTDGFLHTIGEAMTLDQIQQDIYMDIGVYEGKEARFGTPSHYYANFHMRDILRLKGANLMFQTFQGAHDFAMWGDTLVDGLLFLLKIRD